MWEFLFPSFFLEMLVGRLGSRKRLEVCDGSLSPIPSLAYFPLNTSAALSSVFPRTFRFLMSTEGLKGKGIVGSSEFSFLPCHRGQQKWSAESGSSLRTRTSGERVTVLGSTLRGRTPEDPGARRLPAPRMVALDF